MIDHTNISVILVFVLELVLFILYKFRAAGKPTDLSVG